MGTLAQLKALADPARLSIVERLRSGSASVLELVEALGAPQPTVSHHLRVLREAGLVASRRRGRWIDYELVPGALAALGSALAGADAANGRGAVEGVRVVENGGLG